MISEIWENPVSNASSPANLVSGFQLRGLQHRAQGVCLLRDRPQVHDDVVIHATLRCSEAKTQSNMGLVKNKRG